MPRSRLPSSPAAAGLLYQRLADDMAEAMARGLLRAGERLPSVRSTCQQRHVSPATVFQAYALLEARGLIEARPRSGYYVRPQRRPQRALPQAAPVQPQAAPVAVSDLSLQLLQAAQNEALAPLGSAFPASHLFPFDELARCGARAMRRLRPAQITSAAAAGDERLRHALQRRYALHGVALQADEPIVTNGALEALNLCLQAVTRPGDLVAVESPTFYAALQVLDRLGLRALEVRTDPVTGLDVAALAELLRTQPIAACWCMTSFQNPLGALMPEAQKQALVALLTRQQVPLIEDDVYAELYGSAQRPLPAKAFDTQGWVLHCGSFSKSLAPGYRVGWAAAGRFAPKVLRLKTMASLATALPPQLALAEYLAQGGYDRHLRGLRQALSAQREHAQRLMARHFPAGTRVTRPQGGYFLWLELPPEVDTLTLYQRALAEGISTAPGLLFSADGRFTHHLRLNVGHPGDTRFDRAVQRVGELARAAMAGPA
ncbi:MAG: PLP-dependent aminotransferase family protein [Pseudomonadota bacterium]|nr:PLP-dependent aminotransferase family protein [Pseudomonadota bacterium]